MDWTTIPTWWWAVPAGLLLAALLFGLWAWRRRRAQDLDRRLRALCRAMLCQFVIPDGNGGEIEVQYALLTHQGILVVDFKDVDGHVFGSEGMQDWTVINRSRRYTFPNPQPALWDRLAAVRRLLPAEVPVNGCIAFTERAHFSKGRPRSVSSVTELLAELARPPAADEPSADYWLPAWHTLREAAISVRIDHLIRPR